MVCLPTREISERNKVNDKFINIANQFVIRRSTMFFKIFIVKFLINYPKMKTSSNDLLR